MTARIGLDLDGVVYNFTSSYIYLLSEYRDVKFPIGVEWIDNWNAMDRYTTEEDRAWLWTTGIELGLFRHGHLIKGAIDGVRKLDQLGDIEAVSHRPKAAVSDTLAFLSYCQLPLSGVHLLTSEEPKSLVGCDVYVDDGPHVIEELQAAGMPIVIFDAPYNRGLKGPRAYCWQDVPALVRKELSL